jgi:hypothetical protein
MTRQLVLRDIVAPGSLGLNTEQAKGVLSPRWAIEAQNAVLDTEGRLAARRGYSVLTTTPIGGSPAIRTLHEYRTGTGGSVVLLAWDGGISNNTANPVAGDISGAVTDANGTWAMHNFNNKVIGFQAGLVPIVWPGSGNFAHITAASGSAPTGGVGWCGFGRVWGSNADGQTLQYSALLDETHWTTGAGSVDLRNVWVDGTDTIMAITGFNGRLIVFGKRHILVWEDPNGTLLGLTPSAMVLRDVITGTGCLSQLTLTPYGDKLGELLFLSPHGIQSLGRLLIQKSNPTDTLTLNVRRAIVADALGTPATGLRMAYNQEDDIVLCSMPAIPRTWALSFNADDAPVLTTWTLAPTSMLNVAGTFYVGGTFGVAQYTGDSDGGMAFTFRWTSPWLDLGEEFAGYFKILKRYGAVLFARASTTLSFKYYIDFSENARVVQRTITGDAGAEWGIMEWGLFEWGGGLSLRQFKIPIDGQGQYFRLGIEASVTGVFAIQQVGLSSKLGRTA